MTRDFYDTKGRTQSQPAEVEQHPLADGVEVFERLERGHVDDRAVLIP